MTRFNIFDLKNGEQSVTGTSPSNGIGTPIWDVEKGTVLISGGVAQSGTGNSIWSPTSGNVVFTGGGGGGGLTPITFEPEALVLFAAMTAAGDTPSLQRKYTLNKMYVRFKAQGTLWAKLLDAQAGLYIIDNAESSWFINKLSPGTHNLTKVGAPAFTANTGVTTDANTKYYDTGIALNALSQNNAAIGVYITNLPVAAAKLDAGAHDGTNGLTIGAYGSTSVINARCMGGATVGGNTAQWGGANWVATSRTGSTNFTAYHNGLAQEVITSTSTSIVSAVTCRILGAAGSTSFSSNTIAACLICPGLTAAEMEQAHAIIRSTADAIRFGEPIYQDMGFGDASITADVVVYGTTLGGICAAYEAVRQGRTAVICGDWHDRALMQIGGMFANGLGFIDISSGSLAVVSGLFRTIISQANTSIGATDAQTQGDMACWPPSINYAARHMLDPGRVGGILPGANIPLYFSGGISTVQMSGTRITSFTTVDGRTFHGSVFIGADYDGDFVTLMGLPKIQGMEGVGSAPGQDLSGWNGTAVGLPSDVPTTGAYLIDPYITPGVPGSGLIADVIVEPSLSTGQADPAIQAWNHRVTGLSNVGNMAPITTGIAITAPPGYSAARYERQGRLFAAMTLNSYTAQFDDIVTSTRTVRNGARDWNNGACRFGSDLPALTYQNAANYTARAAAMKDLEYYLQGLFYWILQSGDSRIPAALITELQAVGLDGRAYLDPAPGDALYWPGMAYRRDPIWRMKNVTWYWSGHDTYDLTGVPRSTNTIATGCYNNDHHGSRFMDHNFSGTQAIGIPGSINDSSTSKHAPLPMEIFMPDATNCTNFLTPTYPSVTQMVWDEIRIECTLGLAGQGLGIVAAVAINGNTSVQAVNYTTVRNLFLAVPDTVTPVIPQVNAP